MAEKEENEQDSGFPSGPWSGFYIEPRSRNTFHRQAMDLTFTRGRMTGRGQDDVGVFVISGKYELESRQVWWTKTYIGRHSVHYAGVQTGRTIQGDWSLGPFRGGFSIWPGGESGLEGEFFLVEEKPLEQRLPALVED